MTDLFSIVGRTALVTGGSRGIGLMIARGYVEAGARVYISSRKADACERAAAELSRRGTCIALPADLGRMDEVQRLAGELAARESRLDILVNNAGATWGGSIDEFPEAGWDKVMNLNVKGVFFLVQKLLPLLTAAASAAAPARVINIGSTDGLHTPAWQNFSYGPAKAAVHHLTRMLATHLAARHVLVNAIAPGPFLTGMMEPMIASMGAQIISHVPLRRLGADADIAGVAVFLAAPASAYMTGTVIPVDGGLFGAS